MLSLRSPLCSSAAAQQRRMHAHSILPQVVAGTARGGTAAAQHIVCCGRATHAMRAAVADRVVEKPDYREVCKGMRFA